MRMCRVPAVIIAAVIGGAGLTACAASGSHPSAVASAAASGGSAAALSARPGSSPTSALTDTPGSTPTPATSSTHKHSAAAKPSVTAKASVRSTTSPHATSTSSGTHNFTVPAIPGDNVVSAWGSYTKIGTARVKVTMCAKQTGTAPSVGAIALVYNSSGASKNIGAVVLTGPGNTICVGMTFVFYTAHLKVHAFIGDHGNITKTGPVRTIY
jgi:hypothetical protein